MEDNGAGKDARSLRSGQAGGTKGAGKRQKRETKAKAKGKGSRELHRERYSLRAVLFPRPCGLG